MTNLLSRIDEHIEFHEAIDTHKSDVAFLQTAKTKIEESINEFKYFVGQYGCKCGHPHCTPCQDTKDAMTAITHICGEKN